MHFGAVDADEHKSLGSEYGVQGFPTIKVFTEGSKKAVDYNGPRTAKGLVDAGMAEIRKVTRARSGDKKSKKKESKKKESKKNGKKNKSKKDVDGKVVTLTDGNFESTVMNSESMWIVEFYAPWCGHCKNLAPEYKSAAKELKGSGIKLADLDATVHQQMASEYGVKGFPTIKVFPPGSTSVKDAMDYNGARTSDGIVQYAVGQLEKFGGVKTTIVEFIDQSTLESHCEGKAICVIAFLPHILDSKTSGRLSYLDQLEKAAGTVRGKPFKFGWIQANDQPNIESALELSFGFPSVVAVNLAKERYAVQRGAFSSSSIKSFLNGLVSGSQRTLPLPNNFPTLTKVSPWDGKDAPAPTMDDEDDELMKELLKDEL